LRPHHAVAPTDPRPDRGAARPHHRLSATTDAAPGPGSGPAPARQARSWTWSGLALTLALGAAGGYAATQLRMPLAWMMGAMLATTIAAIAGAPLRMAPPLRSCMTTVLGVMVGSTFTPDIFARAGEWVTSLGLLVVYLATISLAMWALLRRYARYDNATAFFSAVPGGFNEMLMIGSALGADDRVLALSHALRILFVVLTIPLWFVVQRGYVGGNASAAGMRWADPLDLVILLSCAVVGGLAARRLRMPAASLLGPMLLSAAVHLTGVTASKPPWLLIALAQLIIGSGVGARFAGVALRQVAHSAAIGLILTVVMLGITLGFGIGLNQLTGISTTVLVLAYAPGGLAEMSLIALFLGEDTAFVSTHHIVRMLVIVTLAPLLFHTVIRHVRWPASRS
jgi:membrane AbrB-like protein